MTQMYEPRGFVANLIACLLAFHASLKVCGPILGLLPVRHSTGTPQYGADAWCIKVRIDVFVHLVM